MVHIDNTVNKSTNTKVITWGKNVMFAPHFDHLDPANAMVPFITLLTVMLMPEPVVSHDQTSYVAYCFNHLDQINAMTY